MKISILIPCYNEEKTIKACVESCLSQSRPADEIVVVNDASTDKSSKILKIFGNKIKVVELRQNTGNKGRAQEIGLKLVTGDVFIATDADTLLDYKFVEKVYLAFLNKNVHAFAGYVKSLKQNWLTACRELEYVVMQNIHKVAQSFIGALFIIPGCAAAYRTDTFRAYISFDHDTLTEDLDFTYKLHEQGFKINYDKSAIVYTQDPSNLTSYINQMRRWYGGGWQNLVKHANVFGRPQNAFELSLLYTDALLFSISIILIPIINLKYFFLVIFLPYVLIITLLASFAAILDKRADLLIYAPFYPIVAFINSWVFIEQFIKEVVIKKKNMNWFQPERRAIA